MTINEYQTRAHEFAFYTSPVITENHGSVNHDLKCEYVYPVMGLTEEAGEVAGKFAKIIRDKNGVIKEDDIEAIIKELGDVSWMLAEICTVIGIDLESVMTRNIEKLTDRRNRKVLTGSGDNR